MTYAAAPALTVKVASHAGVAIQTLQTPDGANGNKFNNDGRTLLRLKNTSAGIITVTVETPGTFKELAIADLAIAVPATTGDLLVGPFGTEYNQPGTSDVFITYSGVTTFTVDVYRLPAV